MTASTVHFPEINRIRMCQKVVQVKNIDEKTRLKSGIECDKNSNSY